jgi:hypothetical protein
MKFAFYVFLRLIRTLMILALLPVAVPLLALEWIVCGLAECANDWYDRVHRDWAKK